MTAAPLPPRCRPHQTYQCGPCPAQHHAWPPTGQARREAAAAVQQGGCSETPRTAQSRCPCTQRHTPPAAESTTAGRNSTHMPVVLTASKFMPMHVAFRPARSRGCSSAQHSAGAATHTPVLVSSCFQALVEGIAGLMSLHSQVQHHQATPRRVVAAQRLHTTTAQRHTSMRDTAACPLATLEQTNHARLHQPATHEDDIITSAHQHAALRHCVEHTEALPPLLLLRG